MQIESKFTFIIPFPVRYLLITLDFILPCIFEFAHFNIISWAIPPCGISGYFWERLAIVWGLYLGYSTFRHGWSVTQYFLYRISKLTCKLRDGPKIEQRDFRYFTKNVDLTGQSSMRWGVIMSCEWQQGSREPWLFCQQGRLKRKIYRIEWGRHVGAEPRMLILIVNLSRQIARDLFRLI